MFVNRLKTLSMSIVFLCMIIMTISCQGSNNAANDKQKDHQIDPQAEADSAISYSDSPGDVESMLFAEYTPLTLEKLQEIRAGSVIFRRIELLYDMNPGYPVPGDDSSILLQGGSLWEQHDYSTIDGYRGNYFLGGGDLFAPNPILVWDFTKAEVDSILDYIENNSEYFFNHEEFDGAEELLTYDITICTGAYTFTISISRADVPPVSEYFRAWGITKCVDEYPAPDHPLYGLLQILEDDFISQFDEENYIDPMHEGTRE